MQLAKSSVQQSLGQALHSHKRLSTSELPPRHVISKANPKYQRRRIRIERIVSILP
jgi:hypothetical protein